MGALSTLKNFFGPRQAVLAHIDDPFVQMDLRETIRKLQLEERGLEQGSLNLPAFDARELDNVEREIVHEVNEALSRAQIEGANQVRTYDGRLAGLSLLTQFASIGANARTAISDFAGEVVNSRNSLATARDAIAESFEDLRGFRVANRLSRPAHGVPSAFVTGGAIFVSWFLESMLNSSLLRMNDSMGWLGGVLAAAAIAALNVGISAFVGRRVWPYLNHVSTFHKVWAGLATVGWGVTFLVWNLLAAHYRDAKAAALGNPEQAALTLLTDQPFGLDSIYSWGLFAAGLMFAIIAALAGYKMDDPYPGYGEVHRRLEQRCENYSDDIASTIEELRAIRDEAIEEAQEVRDELGRQFRERDQILAAREAFRRRFEQHCRQLENSANALLETYRMANRRARTDPAPAHFVSRWEIDAAPLPDSAHATVAEAELRSADAALEDVVREVSQSFDAAVGSFETLDGLKERLRRGAA